MTELWRIRLDRYDGDNSRIEVDSACAFQLRNCGTLSGDESKTAMNSVVLAALRAAGFLDTADEFERAVL